MLSLTCQKFPHSKKQALPKSDDELDSTTKPALEAKCAPAAAKKPVSDRTCTKSHAVDDWLLAKFANNIVVQDMWTHPGKDMYPIHKLHKWITKVEELTRLIKRTDGTTTGLATERQTTKP